MKKTILLISIAMLGIGAYCLADSYHGAKFMKVTSPACSIFGSY